jgi:hypothetical protein
MGFFSSLNVFGRHKKIERFMITFFSVTIPLVFMTGVSIYNKFGLDDQMLASRAVYTTDATFSRTNQTSKVVGVFTNSDKTRGMVLIKFADGVNISSSASDYKVFTTASNLKKGKEDLASKPAGSIYVFGTSGYIGLYFVDNGGFNSQIFKSTIRMEKEFKSVDDKQIVKEQLPGESYSEYDQADFYYNLGATQATKLETLDNPDFSIQDFYVEAVGSKLNTDLRKKITDNLNTMSKTMLQIRELKSRLESTAIDGVGLVVPDLPKEISSDSFSGSGDDILYTTNYVYPGGLNFNWKDIDLKKGYFKSINNKSINPDDLTLSKFLVRLRDQQNKSDVVKKFEHQWVMSDGSKFEDFVRTIGLDNSGVESMSSNVTTYTTLMDTYMETKYNYQTKDLKDLLSLDVTFDNATTNVDSASKDRFLFY